MFAYIDAAASDDYDHAFMEITGVTTGQDYCLEFYYHMYGIDIAAMAVSVHIMRQPLFVIEGGRS